MAIFKRKRDANPDAHAEQPAVPEPAEATAADEAAASVGISVSSYGGFGAAAAAPPAASAPQATAHSGTALGPELAPAPTETTPGLRDNVLLREALAELPAEPSNEDLVAVARTLLQGHLFLRIKGDARTLLSEGKELPLAVANKDDDQYVLAYSSGAALRASVQVDGDTETSAMGQPVLTVLRYVLAGPYSGIIIDPASAPARALYGRALLERLVEAADPQLEIKTLLAGDRTPETSARVGQALARAKFWLAVKTSADGRPGVAEARSDDGSRYIEVYSHPIEVLAMGRGDQPAPMTAEQLAAALRADASLTGVVVDPPGPWIRLTRDDLAPLLSG